MKTKDQLLEECFKLADDLFAIAYDYSPAIPEAVACERLNRIASAIKSIKTHQDPLDQALNEGDGVYKP